MPKDPSELNARFLSKDELAKSPRKKRTSKRVQVVAWLSRQLTIPVMKDGQPVLDENSEPLRRDLEIGEGTEIGPFDSANEGINWMRYYLPDAYKSRGWGKARNKGGKVIPPVTIDPVQKEAGKFYIWVERILE